MKCPGCERELRRDEIAQPALVFGRKVPVRSFCDECCRFGASASGNAAALERLASGKLDEAERARVRAATPSPYDAPLERP